MSTDNTRPGGWGPRRPWTPFGQMMPAGVESGDLIRSDLIVRPHMLEVSRGENRPDYAPSMEWTVVDGISFMETPPPEPVATHMVASWFQVWDDNAPARDTFEEFENPDRLDLDAPGMTDEDRERIEILIREHEDGSHG